MTTEISAAPSSQIAPVAISSRRAARLTFTFSGPVGIWSSGVLDLLDFSFLLSGNTNLPVVFQETRQGSTSDGTGLDIFERSYLTVNYYPFWDVNVLVTHLDVW